MTGKIRTIARVNARSRANVPMPMRATLGAVLLCASTSVFAQTAFPLLQRPSPLAVPGQIRIPVCVQAGVLEVRAGAAAPGDGTAARPFPTIAAAFEWARGANACRLDVHVAAGAYGADLEVTRPTEIVGASRTAVLVTGGIVNRTTHPVGIRHLTFRNTPGVAVSVEASASTTIEDVGFVRPALHAIRQRGGRLVLTSSRVEGTVAGTAERVQGTALHLSGGVQAEISDVLLSANASGALVARGAGVRVIARRLTIRDTGNNPNFPSSLDPVQTTIESAPSVAVPVRRMDASKTLLPGARVAPQFVLRTTGGFWGFGAVAISDGATLFAEDLRIERSALYGLLVFAGGRANVRRAVVTNTTSFHEDPPWGPIWGGVNVWSADGGVIEATDLEVAYGQFGIRVLRAWLTLHSASFHHNYAAHSEIDRRGDFCWDLSRVTAHDNEYLNVDAPTHIEPPCIEDCGTDPPDCETVPWP